MHVLFSYRDAHKKIDTTLKSVQRLSHSPTWERATNKLSVMCARFDVCENTNITKRHVYYKPQT